MTRVLVLRPEPGATATVERARAMGLDVQSVPLFEIKPIEWEAPEVSGFDGLLLTSANAVRCGGEKLQELRGLKAYAVGETTAEAARDAGFDIAATGEAGVDRLLGSIDPELKLLHPCGEDRREPDGARQTITPLVVYRAAEIAAPDIPAGQAVALIHSPRAGRRFAALVTDLSTTSIAAISPAAAQAIGEGWEAVETCEEPSDEALLVLAARLCNKPDPE